ncbi:hypothetical protein Pmani_017848 [Petrolisthes manimaculis]|uniref:Uncharacterized protein n=1 Tax=Petrolisthes manimaculis TaxID=1843537 RepID=A0AAE1U514_9EUCA|nr:hypothetical protein Pmani_017848 [Petrolisthes manimaculis]
MEPQRLWYIESFNKLGNPVVYKLKTLSESRAYPPEFLYQAAHREKLPPPTPTFCDDTNDDDDDEKEDSDEDDNDATTCLSLSENGNRARNVSISERGKLPSPNHPSLSSPPPPPAEPLLKTLKKVLKATKRVLHFFIQDVTGMNTDAVLGTNIAEGQLQLLTARVEEAGYPLLLGEGCEEQWRKVKVEIKELWQAAFRATTTGLQWLKESRPPSTYRGLEEALKPGFWKVNMLAVNTNNSPHDNNNNINASLSTILAGKMKEEDSDTCLTQILGYGCIDEGTEGGGEGTRRGGSEMRRREGEGGVGKRGGMGRREGGGRGGREMGIREGKRGGRDRREGEEGVGKRGGGRGRREGGGGREEGGRGKREGSRGQKEEERGRQQEEREGQQERRPSDPYECGEGQRSASKCDVGWYCWHVMTTPGFSEYSITHQILYFLVGVQAGCGYQLTHLASLDSKVGSIEHLLDGYCTSVLVEADTVASTGFPHHYQDLFMEQGALCGVMGHSKFFTTKWISSVLSWQRSSGCYGDITLLYQQPNTTLHRVRRDERVMSCDCLAHRSAVAVAYLGVAAHYLTNDILHNQ